MLRVNRFVSLARSIQTELHLNLHMPLLKGCHEHYYFFQQDEWTTSGQLNVSTVRKQSGVNTGPDDGSSEKESPVK